MGSLIVSKFQAEMKSLFYIAIYFDNFKEIYLILRVLNIQK